MLAFALLVMLALLAFALMLIPAILMGATLPIISKYFISDNSKICSQVGILYGINTLGAALGCFLTGFFLVATFGILQTVLSAAMINLFIGICAIRIYQESGGNLKEIRVPRLARFSFKW